MSSPSRIGRARTAEVSATVAGTALFAITAVAAAATTNGAVRAVAAATSLGLFAAGIGLFFWAYAVAVSRSRTDAIGIGGLFFLAGQRTDPPSVKQALLGALAAQTAIGLATAAARPFTTLAFGVLVPLYGLALTGLWGARHGTFAPRTSR